LARRGEAMSEERQSRGPGRPRMAAGQASTADNILQVASRLFMEHGFDISTEQVAEAAGVTKAMVYYYYNTKGNLFTVAMIKMMERSRTRTQDILNRDESLYHRLLDIATVRLRIHTPFDFNALVQKGQTGLTKQQLDRIQLAEEALFQTVADAFQKSSELGEIRPVRPVLCARVYMALLMAQSTQAGTFAAESTADAARQRAEESLQILWRGVGLES